MLSQVKRKAQVLEREVEKEQSKYTSIVAELAERYRVCCCSVRDVGAIMRVHRCMDGWMDSFVHRLNVMYSTTARRSTSSSIESKVLRESQPLPFVSVSTRRTRCSFDDTQQSNDPLIDRWITACMSVGIEPLVPLPCLPFQVRDWKRFTSNRSELARLLRWSRPSVHSINRVRVCHRSHPCSRHTRASK